MISVSLQHQQEEVHHDQRQTVEVKATEHGGCQEALGSPRAIKSFREKQLGVFGKKTQAGV